MFLTVDIICFVKHLIHYDKLGTTRFITFSCHRRMNLFLERNSFLLFLHSLDRLRQKYSFRLLGYVIMPNHVHLVIYPSVEMALGHVMGELKAHSAFHIIRRWKLYDKALLKKLEVMRNGKSVYALWQRRCYDHNCRSVGDVREKINYCHNNPVRARLVSDPGEWLWSSYRWYSGYKDGPIEINDIPL